MAQQRARRVWMRVEEHSIAQSKAAVYARNERRKETASPCAWSFILHMLALPAMCDVLHLPPLYVRN
jgi:hypothetical protein